MMIDLRMDTLMMLSWRECGDLSLVGRNWSRPCPGKIEEEDTYTGCMIEIFFTARAAW
jgi:hypothetical protein